MKLLQLYYTSAKRGLSANSGFQVYAASEGLTEDEIYELEEICLYVAPSHLPNQPTEAEIKELFPISFASFQLESGRYGVVQSVYIGKDYSGRYGNYFAHVLVLEEGDWPFAPISLYNSPLFRHGLTERELEIDTEPAPLLPISITEPNGTITSAAVRSFLQKHDRYDLLKNMLNHIIELRSMPSSIVLAADKAEIPYWIGAIQFAFPPAIAHNLSFSTYSYDPEQDRYTVAVTLDEGTRFSFDRELSRTDLYAINLLTDEWNEAAETYRYTDYVIENNLQVGKLFDAFAGFTMTSPSADLDAFIDYFNLFYKTSANTINDDFAVNNAIQFINKYGSITKSVATINQLPLDQLLADETTMETATTLANFLKETYNETKETSQGDILAAYILEKTAQFIEAKQSLTETESFLFGQVNDLHSVEPIFTKLFAMTERITRLLVSNNDLEFNLLYAKIITKLLQESNTSWDDLEEVGRLFITQVIEPIYLEANIRDDIKAIFTQQADLFAHLSVAIDSRQQDERLASIFSNNFIDIFSANDRDTAWLETVHNVLQEYPSGKALLSYYYGEQVQRTESIAEMTHIVANAAEYQVPNFERLLIIFMNELKSSDSQFIKNIVYVLNNQTLYSLLEKEKQIDNLLQISLRELVFTDQAIQENRRELATLLAHMRNNGYETSLFELALVTYEVKQAKRKDYTKLERVLLANLNDPNNLLSGETLEAYVKWVFPELIELIYQQKNMTSKLKAELIQAQPEMILNIATKRREKIKVKNFHHFLIDLFTSLYDKQITETTQDQFAQYLGDYESDLKKMNTFLQKQPAQKKQWDTLYEKVQQEKGGNFVSSLKGLFRSKK